MVSAVQSFAATALGMLAGLFVLFLFCQFISWSIGLGDVSERIRQDEEITNIRATFNSRRINVLNEMGSPRDNGQWDAEQQMMWDYYHQLEREEEIFLSGTEVVNLEPLGDRTGRVYRK